MVRARRACLCFGLGVGLVAGLTTDNHKLNAPRSALMPIVIVPGTGGSQLELRKLLQRRHNTMAELES